MKSVTTFTTLLFCKSLTLFILLIALDMEISEFENEFTNASIRLGSMKGSSP